MNRKKRKFQFLWQEFYEWSGQQQWCSYKWCEWWDWQHKTWCKYECSAPMETSIEGVCCLETPEIYKPRFSSTSCLNVCRSDPSFLIWFSRRENFVSFLISTQCWSLANQNGSFLSLQTSRLSLFLKRYILPYYLIRSFSL